MTLIYRENPNSRPLGRLIILNTHYFVEPICLLQNDLRD